MVPMNLACLRLLLLRLSRVSMCLCRCLMLPVRTAYRYLCVRHKSVTRRWHVRLVLRRRSAQVRGRRGIRALVAVVRPAGLVVASTEKRGRGWQDLARRHGRGFHGRSQHASGRQGRAERSHVRRGSVRRSHQRRGSARQSHMRSRRARRSHMESGSARRSHMRSGSAGRSHVRSGNVATQR